jgi:hypothetical protein
MCYYLLQELSEARKKRRKRYYTLELVSIVYLDMPLPMAPRGGGVPATPIECFEIFYFLFL